jgi:16S rRNA (guanine527-N7)-methyltransferase
MEQLQRDIQALLGFKLTPKQVSSVETFERELLDWNARFNLTAIRNPEAIRTKHFLDSLSCLMVMRDRPLNRLIDVGTGAGFPGILIKIAMPSIQLTLVESVGKKAEFCYHIIQILGLDKVEVIPARVENVGQSPRHREQYDWAVARAVANLATLAEYLLPLVHIGGAMLAQKGEAAPIEVQAADKAIKMMGGKLKQIHPLTLPGIAEERYLIVIDKIAACPPQYPRRVGVPAKKPIQ